MKKLSYLIVLVSILSLTLAGCVILFNPMTPSLNLEKGTSNTDNGVCIDLANSNLGLSPGDSIEGGGILFPYLNISSSGDVVVLEDGNSSYATYGAPNGSLSRSNGCIGTLISSYGFGDLNRNHDYIFTFTSGLTVSSFSLRMLDFGDYFPLSSIPHSIQMTVYDADGLIYTQTLEINKGRDLLKGDACTAIPGDPGNYVFEVNAPGIVRVEIHPVNSIDPNIGFNDICFTLEPIEVPLDIKPWSCPNPLNVKSKGVLPVAILGTADFDVTQVDPESIILEDVVTSLRWALEDVATPYTPFVGKEDYMECNTDGPDGYLDLTLKFDTLEVVDALGNVSDGDVLVLKVTGNLLDDFGGIPFVGEDVIIIIKKGK